MSYKVKKAVVLGSGVMGSGIACHLANVGIDVLMLDIQPNDKSIKNKNLIADESLKNAIKSRPNPLYKKEYAKRITTGNFDDDFEKIKNADWIIEVIVENLEIKRKVFEKVEKFKSDHAFVTSNNLKYLGGLKKCVPQNLDLKLSDLPSHKSDIGILDVFEVTKA